VVSRPGSPPTAVITNARPGASADKARRQRNYLIAMAFRVFCFLGMLVVGGWLRWVMLAVAVFTPIVAVMIANNVKRGDDAATPIEHGEPEPHLALTLGTSEETTDPADEDRR